MNEYSATSHDSKVYFSKVGDCDKWIDDNDAGQFKIILFPMRWWNINDWKLCLDFSKNFRSGFITRRFKNG